MAKVGRWMSLLALLIPTITGTIFTGVSIWNGSFGVEHVQIWVTTWIAITFGITLYYHRHVTHRSFQFSAVGKWTLRPLLAWGGALGLQGPPGWWCAIHRLHHRHSDEEGDVHSPYWPKQGPKGWAWAHFLWIPDTPRPERPTDLTKFDKVVSHIMSYIVLGPVSGALLSYWWSGDLLGIAWYLNAVFVSTCILTWAINSLCHLVGSRPHKTGDRSANIYVLGLLTGGESIHNGHHAHQRSPRFAHRWWELLFDTGYQALLIFYVLRLVHFSKMPSLRH